MAYKYLLFSWCIPYHINIPSLKLTSNLKKTDGWKASFLKWGLLAYFQRRLLLGLGGVFYESHWDPPLKHLIKPCFGWMSQEASKWLGSMDINGL